MKKYFYSILGLSILGAIISGVLLIQHYLPNANFGVLSCDDTAISSCASVSQSPYSELFGIPVAAFGLLFYLFFIFFALICDYAGDIYVRIFAIIGLILAAMGIGADLVLISTLIYIKMFCHLCATTYLINAIIFAILLIFYLKHKSSLNLNIKSIIKDFKLDSDKKAVLALFILFAFLLCFSMFQLNETLRATHGSKVVTQQEIDDFVKKFNDSPVEMVSFPQSRLIFGNPNAKLSIVVYTDFLCTACRNFYNVEKRILRKYSNDVNFIYYHYPMDQTCNNLVSRTIYPNSCLASNQIETAAAMNILSDYLAIHFSKYREFAGLYNHEWADKVLEAIAKKNNWKQSDIALFNDLANSANHTIESHVESAGSNRVNGTPTLFINGRRLTGVPKFQLLEAVIKQELGR